VATLPAANTAEGGSNGTTITTGNSGGGSGSAWDTVTIDASALAVFDNGAAMHGSLANKLTGSGSGGVRLEWNSTQTTIYGRAYCYISAFPAGTTNIIDARNGAAEAASIRLNASKKLDIYDGLGNLVASGTTVLTATTWYRIEFQFVFSTSVGSITARLYAGDSGTITETITASSLNTNSQMTLLRFAWRTFTTDSIWYDDLQLNTTGYPGASGGTDASVTPAAVGGVVTVPVAVSPTLPRDNTAEGGTHTVDVTTGNSGGVSGYAWDAVTLDSGGLAKFNNLHAMHGVLGYKLTGSGNGGAFLAWSTPQTTIYGRAYLLVQTFPAGTTSVIDARNSGVNAAAVRLNAAKKLEIWDGLGNLVGTGTTVLVQDTWYRIEFQFVFGLTTGSITARLYSGDSTTLLETITASSLNTNSAMTDIRFSWRSFTTDSAWFDDLQVNTTGFPGPATGTNATATALVVAALAAVRQPSIGSPGQRFVLRQAAQRASRW